MRAITKQAEGVIAVVAQHAIAGRISLVAEGLVESPAFAWLLQGQYVLPAAASDVVDGEKLVSALAAAGAVPTVDAEHFELETQARRFAVQAMPPWVAALPPLVCLTLPLKVFGTILRRHLHDALSPIRAPLCLELIVSLRLLPNLCDVLARPLTRIGATRLRAPCSRVGTLVVDACLLFARRCTAGIGAVADAALGRSKGVLATAT